MSANSTIAYYDSNAQDFVDRTIKIPKIHTTQDDFLALLKPHSLILDLGCGSGRDTKYFLDQGFHVDALDGSIKLCQLATEFTGIEVRHADFNDLNDNAKYDGIWACASLLHLPKSKLPAILAKIYATLKPNGIFYASFKYGNFEGERHHRHFTDMTEPDLIQLFSTQEGFRILKIWQTEDARNGREGEKWLNGLVQKSNPSET